MDYIVLYRFQEKDSKKLGTKELVVVSLASEFFLKRLLLVFSVQFKLLVNLGQKCP